MCNMLDISRTFHVLCVLLLSLVKIKLLVALDVSLLHASLILSVYMQYYSINIWYSHIGISFWDIYNAD